MSFTFGDLRRWFAAHGVGCEFNQAALGASDAQRMAGITFDSRDAAVGSVFCAVAGEHTHGIRFVHQALSLGASGLWVEADDLDFAKELSPECPVVATSDARRALAVAARMALRESDASVVGITGSNGKTTTKDFTRAALSSRRTGASRGNLNSSWGLPAVVLGKTDDLEILVLEMGASSPGEIATLCEIAPPRVACITNISGAHLEFFGTRDEVARTKAAIIQKLPTGGVAVLPRDDDYFGQLCEVAGQAAVLSFGQSDDADIRVTELRSSSRGILCRIDGVRIELPVFGEVNALNAAAAVAVAKSFDVATADALRRIEQVELSPHRSRVASTGDGWVIDDSYNANPTSVRAALASLAARPAPGRRVAVLGTMAELGEESESQHIAVLRAALAAHIDRVWAVGGAMIDAARHFEDDRLCTAGGVSELLALWGADRRPNDTVLVKGSRSVGLERVVQQLQSDSSTKAIRKSENGETT
jgi:UDP-N-acetylmuramoyl-tripeptide--D-alanyl-D-alanine ligase